MRRSRSRIVPTIGVGILGLAILSGCSKKSGHGGTELALLEFAVPAVSVGEGGGTVTLTVTRTGRLTGIVSVDYASSGGTATAGIDYGTSSGQLTWADGDGADKGFSVPILEDFAVEGDETVLLTLSNPVGGATLGGVSTIPLTITDNDLPGEVRFGGAAAQVVEGALTATIVVSRVGGVGGTVTVDYGTSDGTATAPTDYTPAAGTLTWTGGDGADKTFTVDIVDDAAVEPNETVNLTLSNPTGGATLGSPAAAVLTILDDDAPSSGALHFSASTYQVDEGGVVATIPVSRTAGSSGTVTIDYATSDGTATDPADYSATAGALSWPDGDSADRTFTVSITDDFAVEGAETITLTLSNPGGGATLGSPGVATLTIVENDSPGVIQFAQATYQVVEGSLIATVAVSRVGGVGDAVGIDFTTSDGTATAPQDYTPASGQLTWAPGDGTDKIFTVAIADDASPESAETIDLGLSNPTGGAGLGTPITATLTIIDDDSASPGTLQFSQSTADVGAYDGSETVTVTRTGGTNGAVSVQYSTSDGTAAAPGDYAATSGTLNWAAADATPQTFTVPIVDDILAEGDETVNLALSGPTGGATLGTPATATVTIREGWTKHPGNPVFAPAPTPAWDDQGVGQPSVLGPPSGFPQYLLWYWGDDQATGTGQFGYATSPDGITWTGLGASVLSMGTTGEWDETVVGRPCCLYDTSTTTYRLYYSGEDAGGLSRIGLATSADGITWSKSSSNPILSPTASGRWDDGGVFFPCVVKDGATFRMWYTGVEALAPGNPYQIGLATSTDGVNWTRFAGSPVLSPDPLSFEGAGVGMPSVVEDGTPVFRMLYSGDVTGSRGGVQRIGYARSLDSGETWEKYQDLAGLPVPVLDVGAAGEWDEILLYSATWETFPPSEMWYEGEDSTGLLQVGYALHR